VRVCSGILAVHWETSQGTSDQKEQAEQQVFHYFSMYQHSLYASTEFIEKLDFQAITNRAQALESHDLSHGVL
jgi:homoserine acetyltransferase